MTAEDSLSVVIPVGPDEHQLGRLASDLLLLPEATELLLVVCKPACSYPWKREFERLLAGRCLRWVQAPAGRAQQMNAGAAAASGSWLWFLHWDSGFGPDLVSCLLRAMDGRSDCLYYARLAFMTDGPPLTRLNAAAANWRSRRLGVPFGDQGFALSRELFERLGGYDTDAAFGEDHLLVWCCRLAGGQLEMLDAPLLTSARKYDRQGWWRLTLRYQRLWVGQAWPFAWRLYCQQLSRRRSTTPSRSGPS